MVLSDVLAMQLSCLNSAMVKTSPYPDAITTQGINHDCKINTFQLQKGSIWMYAMITGNNQIGNNNLFWILLTNHLIT